MKYYIDLTDEELHYIAELQMSIDYLIETKKEFFVVTHNNNFSTKFDFAEFSLSEKKQYKHLVIITSDRVDSVTKESAGTITSYYYSDDEFTDDDVDFLAFLHTDCDYDIVKQIIKIK